MKPKVSKEILKLIEDRKSIKLDIACGASKQGPDWIGMDIQKLPGVDIVHNIEIFPWPLPSASASIILASHIVEHISPAHFGFVNWMNECWRVLITGGELMIAMPYGVGYGFVQDPTHCNPCNETTWSYFDPLHQDGLYRFYEPAPWKIKTSLWDISGNMEVVLVKRMDDISYHRSKKVIWK